MSTELADRIAMARPRLVDGCELTELDGGRLRIRGPVLRRGPVRRRLARLLRFVDRLEAELDEIGTWVVQRMDGRSMHRLADELAIHLKLTHREAEAALTVFLQMLLKRKLIVLDLGEDVEKGR